MCLFCFQYFQFYKLTSYEVSKEHLNCITTIAKGDTIGTITIPNYSFSHSIVYGLNNEILNQQQIGTFFGKKEIMERNHLILAGHNQYGMFRVLEKLKIGDEIEIILLGKQMIYQVTAKRIVDATELFYFNETEEPLLTLMTCDRNSEKRILFQAKKN